MSAQKGAALIVVLSLLVGALVIGLSSMQSSMMDERLAGNQKISSEVQMAAEDAAAFGLERYRQLSSVEGISSGDPASVVFGIMIGEGCSVENLFLTSSADRSDFRWSGIDSAVAGWSDMIDGVIDRDKPCADYTGWPSGSTTFAEPQYSDGYALLKDDMSGLCEAPIVCSYRYVSLDSDPSDSEPFDRYVVGVAAFEKNGKVVSESRPVFVELKLDDPPNNLDWIFEAPPITLLAFIANLSVNGANNLTLDGVGGADILANAGNVDVLYEGFFVGNPSGKVEFEPDVSEVDLGEFGLGDLIPIIQTMKDLSDQGVPGITFVTESPDMDAVEDGVLVVADSFVWNGTHDFNGTIIVLGPSADYNGMGNSEFLGAFIHAPLKLINPSYDWLDVDEYVDFSKVDEFRVEDWRFLEADDATQTSFDFNGLGKALLKNDSDVQMRVSDNVVGELADAPVLSWEQD